MIDHREVRWLALVLALGACAPDTSKPAQETAPAESNSVARNSEAANTTSIEAASPDPESDVSPSRDVITADGWGPLRIGMSLAAVTAAAGADANPGAVGGPDPERCDEFRPANAPKGVLVMIEEGVLTRISVSRNTTIRTPEGLRIGDPASKVLAQYGSRAHITPHPYWPPPARSITVWRTSPAETDRRGIRYEVDAEGHVVHIRAGGRSVENAEGCV